MLHNDNIYNAINSPVRYIKARVELYSGSTLLTTFNDTDKLISFTIERVGDESKFFGFGVFQKINIKLIDKDRELDITTSESFRVIYNIAGEDLISHPTFYVTEVHRDENTNELSITAYDALHKAKSMPISDTTLNTTTNYTILSLYTALSAFLDVESCSINTRVDNEYWRNISFTGYGNYEPTEFLKEVLDDIAEATQTIYYVNHADKLVMARIYPNTTTGQYITKDKYITLDSYNNRRLSTIITTTELGDNITNSVDLTGSTQYIRDNGLIANREDIVDIIADGLAFYVEHPYAQFEMEWRGNPLTTILDKYVITTKDNNTITGYLINDTVTYNGAYSHKTQWVYEDNQEETDSNPSNLGEALKQTYARVDKVNKEIALVASQSEENSKEIAQLKIDTDSITAGVSSAETAIDELTGQISTLQEQVALTITSKEVEIAIESAVSNGVDKVETATGFTFNEDGLTISKSDSDISTLIDEDGMDISKGNTKVLTADNTGVNAINLTANQFLIIGNRSRFENYGSSRTGCFWIGG